MDCHSGTDVVNGLGIVEQRGKGMSWNCVDLHALRTVKYTSKTKSKLITDKAHRLTSRQWW